MKKIVGAVAAWGPAFVYKCMIPFCKRMGDFTYPVKVGDNSRIISMLLCPLPDI
jgi:hypothetical protein